VLHTITYDRVEACDWLADIHSTVDEACVIDRVSHEMQTFRWVKLFAQEALVCYIEHEAYEHWGGPHPYHDAFVYAIYLREIERLSFQQLFLRAALEHEILLTDVVSGAKTPSTTRQGWLRKILRIFT
jgi:hypothetical protein